MNKLLIITLVSVFAFQYSVGQSHVQTTTLYQNPSTKTIALTFGAASTAKNLIVVHLDWDNQSRTVSSVTDNNGNTYHKINGPTNWNGGSNSAALYYAYNINGGAVITVTAQLSGAPTSYLQMYISEYSGIAASIDPLDQNAAVGGNNATVSSGNKTTTFSNELVYGASIGASGLLTKGTGFTARSTANQNVIEDKNVTAKASYSTNFTSAGGNWVAQMATFIATSSVLPVTLSSFTEQCQQNSMLLNWTTATESNNAFFAVEGSVDGTSWNDIASVKAVGNSTIPQQYSYTVDPTNQNITWFRLKQTDLDGRFVYSRVIGGANCTIAGTSISIFPNPTTGNTLSGIIGGKPGQEFEVDIFDIAGKILHRASVNQGPFQLRLPTTLPTGVYYARFISPASSSVTAFVVNH